MYNTVIGVGAAVLVGGVALYTGYQMTQRDGPDADVRRAEVSETERVGGEASDARAAAGRIGSAGRRGVPEGSEALDFAEGAAGDRIAPTADALDAEARREAERLAALGSGGVLGDDAEDLGRSVDALAQDADGRVGAPRGGDEDAGDRGSASQPIAQIDDRDLSGAGEARGGLRGALRDAPIASAETDRAGSGDADASTRTAGASGTQTFAPSGTTAAGAGAPPRLDGQAQGVATARNASLTDKPETVRNAAFVDKPDGRLARLVDKPDNSPYFAATDAAPSFDPCVKADGTPYVGPGTAINPFADGDPCLPRATGQSFEVAQVTTRPGLVTASDLGSRSLRVLPFVDLVQPGFIAAPPVGTDFGSDYRQ